MVEILSGAGHPVVALSLAEVPEDLRRTAHRVVIGDAADPRVLADVTAGTRHVIWTAGALMPREAELDPDRDRELTLSPLRTLASLGPELAGQTVTYISSGGTVYGNPGEEPVSEDHPPSPIGA